jgi:uncharacterized repeat protein (TIGR01451 family)
MRRPSHTRGCSRSTTLAALVCALGLWSAFTAAAFAAPLRPELASATSAAPIELYSPLRADPDTVPVDDSPLAELNASEGETYEELGQSVAASGSTVVAGAPLKDDGEGAAYVFGAASGKWPQQAKLTAGANSKPSEEFGDAVAISGTTMVVGVPGEDGRAGKAYVFTYSQESWSEQAELIPESTIMGSNFGASVAISGSTVVVGAPGENGDPGGKAYVFNGSGASWSQQAELTPGEDIGGSDDFGDTVAISGSTVVIGDPTAEVLRGDPSEHVESGAAYVFNGSGASWSEQAELTAADGAEGDGFGGAVAISGSTILVGAADHADDAGAAYVFTNSAVPLSTDSAVPLSKQAELRTRANASAFGDPAMTPSIGSGGWSEQAELTPPEGGGAFGEAVAISGSTAIVGAPNVDSGKGAADVFTDTESSWSEQSELTPPQSVQEEAGFGASLSISGSTLAVGASLKEDHTGAAYVFELELAPPPPPPTPEADLSLTAGAEPNPVTLGEELTDTFTIANNGPDEAEGVSLSDSLPSGATLKSASASEGTCIGTEPLTCTLGQMKNGARATVTVVLEPTQAGTILNTAAVASATADPNSKNNSATATATAKAPKPPPPSCESSMTLEAVQVLASCIKALGNGTYLAEGNTRFSNGASIVLAGTQTPASLLIDPASHTIALAPASGGGAQTGELEVAGVDVATGQLVIATQGKQDPVSGVAGGAAISGIGSVDLALSGWTFSDIGVTPTAYLAPSGAGGGVIVDGQMTLPYYLGSVLDFGPPSSIFSSGFSGQLAVQVTASGAVGVHNGGISIKEVAIPDTPFTIQQAHIGYTQAGDEWTGEGMFVAPYIANLAIDPVVISHGKLDDLAAHFECGKCSSGSEPKIGSVLEVKDIALEMSNLQGINYTPPSGGLGGLLKPVSICIPLLHVICPAPPKPPQIDGEVAVGALGGHILAGGNFTYLLDGAFNTTGEIGMAPLHEGHFPIPTSTHGLESTLSAAKYGINIAAGTLSFLPPHLLEASGTVLLPPLPSPQFLKGTLSIGIDSPHFTGEGALDLIVPPGAPILGGDDLGGVQALISDKAAAGEVSAGVCLPSWLGGHCYTEHLVIAYVFASGSFQFNLGGNINDYATVSQAASTAAAGASRRTVHLPRGRRFAAFTIRSTRGTPDVELISPPVRHRRLTLTLAGSRRRGNHSGALASVASGAHEESFLVALPPGGSWTVRRLRGPKIASVRVSVPRETRAGALPRLTPRASDLPHGTISTGETVMLHYSVPNAPAGTTVELWAGTRAHGAGGVMIADGLPPSGTTDWKLSGLEGGRYWPYAIVNENGVPVAIDYWPGSVDVVNPVAPPAPGGVSATVAAGQVFVTWQAVGTASAYAVTATPVDGGTPVQAAVTAEELGAVLSLPKGQWSIAVQAVDAQNLRSAPSSAPQIVSMP